VKQHNGGTHIVASSPHCSPRKERAASRSAAYHHRRLCGGGVRRWRQHLGILKRQQSNMTYQVIKRSLRHSSSLSWRKQLHLVSGGVRWLLLNFAVALAHSWRVTTAYKDNNDCSNVRCDVDEGGMGRRIC